VNRVELVQLLSVGFLIVYYYIYSIIVFFTGFLFAGVWWPFSSNRLMPFSSTVVTRVKVCKCDNIMHFE